MAGKGLGMLRGLVFRLQGDAYEAMVRAKSDTAMIAGRSALGACADVLAGTALYLDQRYLTPPTDPTHFIMEVRADLQARRKALERASDAHIRGAVLGMDISLEHIGETLEALARRGGRPEYRSWWDRKEVHEWSPAHVEERLSEPSARNQGSAQNRASTASTGAVLVIHQGRRIHSRLTVEASENKVASALAKAMSSTYFAMKPIAKDLLTSREERVKIGETQYRITLE